MRPRWGGLESDSQTLMPPLLLHHPEMMFYSLARLDLHRSIGDSTLARGNGEDFNTTNVTASAAGPTKSLLWPALIYTSAQMAALLKPQNSSLQTLPYSPRVDVSGTRWRNVQRKSFMHDKLFLATSRNCFKEVWIELR